jgi:hypothetical protein
VGLLIDEIKKQFSPHVRKIVKSGQERIFGESGGF